MSLIDKQIEILYKEKFGQLITLIVKRFPSLSLESVEDIVQEVFAQASIRWVKQDVPDNPSGWLYQSCRNKAINLLKRSAKTEDLIAAEGIESEVTEISEHSFKDAQLQMLMGCCHPNLPPKIQVIMALKYVANFKVEEIALQLGLEQSAVEKLLYRARQKIKVEDLNLSYASNFPHAKLSVVHKVIYLIFHEGYRQSGEKPDHGKALCEDALILNKSLYDSSIGNSETKALQALMLFNIARFDTRFDVQGNAIELEYQNRTLWNDKLILLGHHLLLESEGTEFSQYHLEAAIAFVHCAAKKFEDTDWGAICRYYETLLKIYPSPFAEINYAVALQYSYQDEKALYILTELHQNPWFNKLPILNTSLQKCLERIEVKKAKAL